MAPPVVTVLLPARNAESTVARAVGSLREGTLREIRVMVVDDGSTDGTRAVLQGLAARDARVEVLDGGGRGLVAALNLALSQATSPYVARMDADDEALPRRLEASVADGPEVRAQALHLGESALSRTQPGGGGTSTDGMGHGPGRAHPHALPALGGSARGALHRRAPAQGGHAHPRDSGVPAGVTGSPREDTHLVAAVGVRGIRDEIRGALTGLGWVEGIHFTCAA